MKAPNHSALQDHRKTCTVKVLDNVTSAIQYSSSSFSIIIYTSTSFTLVEGVVLAGWLVTVHAVALRLLKKPRNSALKPNVCDYSGTDTKQDDHAVVLSPSFTLRTHHFIFLDSPQCVPPCSSTCASFPNPVAMLPHGMLDKNALAEVNFERP